MNSSSDVIIFGILIFILSSTKSLLATDPFSKNRPIYDSSHISPDHVVLNSAVCKASCYHKCLQMPTNISDAGSQTPQRPTMVHSRTSRIELQCKTLHESFTTACISACEYSGHGGTIGKECSNNCRGNNDGCAEGCQFLATALKISLGNCPEKLETNKLFDRECHLDQQCMSEGDVKKCCNLRCVVPTFHSKIGPNLWPPSIMEGKDGSSFEMTWKYDNRVFTESMVPILFVLQVRTYFSRDFEPNKASNWKTLLITFQDGVHLQDLQPGMWYQFRVASVTNHGTNGFKSVSPPVKLAKTPGNPGLPRSLSDGAWRIQANGKINIRLHWIEPAFSDLPITEYKISWVRDHGFTQPDGQSLEALTDFVQTVPGSQRMYDIEGLIPDKTYKVQVSAICKWGSSSLASMPNTIFLTTPQTPTRELEQVIFRESSLSNDPCTCSEGQLDKNIQFSNLYFHENSLKVDIFIANAQEQHVYKISYTPNVCIDTESLPISSNHPGLMTSENADLYRERSITAALPNATLGPLQFSCRYTIQVQPLRIRPSSRWIRKQVNIEENQKLLSSCLCTPSCLSLMSQNQYLSANLRCLHKLSPILEPPNKLLFQRSQKNPESFLVFWDYMREDYKETIADAQNFRYRVIWGPSIDDHIDRNFINSGEDQLLMPRLDMSQAETKVLKENVSSIWLENLKKNTYYIVQVQAIFYHQEVEQISKSKFIVLSTYRDPSFQKLSVFNVAMNRHGSYIFMVLSIFCCWYLET